jgi:hypothetical protein
LRDKSTRELLSLFSGVLEELRVRGAVRTGNNPVGDYAEALAAKALSLRLLPRSNTGCDAEDAAGARYEIKGRRITRHNGSTQLSALRGLDKCHFDFLVGVLFNADFSVQRACLIPHAVVARTATYRSHVNAWILLLRPSVWDETGVEDITGKLQAEQAKNKRHRAGRLEGRSTFFTSEGKTEP